MKTKFKYIIYITAIALLLFAFLYIRYAPVREFYRITEYKGENNFDYRSPVYDSAKKTVLLVADNPGTEIFDLITPFYFFSLTQKANVYIVAQKKYPITIRKGLYLLPHYTYQEIDSLNIHPDVMVIPRLSHTDKKPEDTTIIKWIRNKYVDSTKLLSVCWGAVTAAATGLYDGKPLTSHAIRFETIKKQFPNPKWVKNISVTQSGNLYSTAGVSNAVEGSLRIIHDLFGEEVMKAVLDSVHYPYPKPKMEHHSIELTTENNLTIAKKIYFKKHKDIGVLLQDDIDEFELASVLDTYHRTFPGSIETFTTSAKSVTTKHGLTIIPTGDSKEIKNLYELHVLNPTSISATEQSLFGNTTLVKYNPSHQEYIINLCLNRIKEQYGEKLENVVRVILDYN
jgi:putative intracellular protease/amidase